MYILHWLPTMNIVKTRRVVIKTAGSDVYSTLTANDEHRPEDWQGRGGGGGIQLQLGPLYTREST